MAKRTKKHGSLAKALRQNKRAAYIAAILDAGEQVIVDVGYEGATMTAIAEAAGVSVGTLYNYFPSKDDVFDAMKRRARADLMRGIEVAVEAADTAEARLTRLVSATFAFVVERGALVAVGREMGERGRDREAEASFATILVELLQQAKKAKAMRSDLDPDFAVAAFGGLMNGIIESWIASEGTIDLEQQVEPLLRLFFDGARPPQAAARRTKKR